MKLYGIKNCDSVKKARDFLDKKNIRYDFFDLKIYKPEISDITRWATIKGIDKVLNSKGKTYKNLNLKNLNLDFFAKISQCCDNPMLLKRPIIDFIDEGINKVVIGFDENEFLENFGEK